MTENSFCIAFKQMASEGKLLGFDLNFELNRCYLICIKDTLANEIKYFLAPANFIATLVFYIIAAK